MSNLIRLQVEIEPNKMAELERLQELGSLRTKKDLLDNAVTILKWAARETAKGHSIASLNQSEGTVRVLQMPFLDNVALNAASGPPTEFAAPQNSQISHPDPKPVKQPPIVPGQKGSTETRRGA
jgi:hypothetical protein